MVSTGQPSEKSDEWIAYCAFHLGDYAKALQVQQRMAASILPIRSTRNSWKIQVRSRICGHSSDAAVFFSVGDHSMRKQSTRSQLLLNAFTHTYKYTHNANYGLTGVQACTARRTQRRSRGRHRPYRIACSFICLTKYLTAALTHPPHTHTHRTHTQQAST